MRQLKDKTKQCIECNKDFQYKRKEQKLCSKECQSKNRSKQSKDIRVCANENCKTEFETIASAKKIFCSSNCSAKINNAKRPTKREVRCCARKQCSEEFLIAKHREKKYCSHKCSTASKNEEHLEGYLNGTFDGTVSSGLSLPISIYLKEQAGWRCQNSDCCVPGGWSVVNPTTGKVPVEIEHIDGNCFNNKPDNLIVLCPNCHSLTSTYKALNKNSGRTYRSRYKQFE